MKRDYCRGGEEGRQSSAQLSRAGGHGGGSVPIRLHNKDAPTRSEKDVLGRGEWWESRSGLSG